MQGRLPLCRQVSVRSPLWAAEGVIRVLHDTMTQTSREHKWAILRTPNKSLAYKQGSIFTPECTRDPRVEAKLVLVTKLRTADLTWVLSGRGGVTGTVIFSRRDPLAFVSGRSNRRITRGHKLLIITRQLWRVNRELCGSPSGALLVLFCHSACRGVFFYYACTQLFTRAGEIPPVCRCKTIGEKLSRLRAQRQK